jgi:hypothetical protein
MWKEMRHTKLHLISNKLIDQLHSRHGPVTGSCEIGNEASGSTKGGEFLDQMSDYQVLKYSAALN